jgi:branched-chain amino acid transport system substrate-binding protein
VRATKELDGLNNNSRGERVKTGTKRIGIGLVLLVCLLIVGIVTGCTKPAPTTVKEWNLPMLTILTGPVAYAGVPCQWGAQYAVDEINASGGVRGVPIKLTVYDTAFDPAKAVECYAKAIPGSLLVLGPLDGVGAAAGSESIKEAKIANITDASEAELRAMMEPYGISYLQDTGKSLPACALKWLELNPNIKKVAIFYMPAQPSSQYTFETTQAALTQAGFKVVPIEFSPTEVEFGPAVLKAMDDKADGYIVAALEPHYIGIGKELYNHGITQGTELLGTFACTGPELFTVGKGFLENAYCQENDNPIYDSPEWQKIMAAYDQEYPGQVPPATVLEFYDAVYLFKNAVETLELTGDPAKLAQEREALAKYVYNTPEIQGMQYPYQNVNGDKVAPVFLLQIKNNAYTVVAEVTLQ